MIPIDRRWLLRRRSSDLDASRLPYTVRRTLSRVWRKNSSPGECLDTTPEDVAHGVDQFQRRERQEKRVSGQKKKERGPLRQFPVEAVDDPVARQTAQTAWITIVAASIATEQAPFTLSIIFGVFVYISFSPLLYGNQFPLLFLIILTQYGVKWAKFCLQRSSNPQSLFLRLSSESGVPPAR